MSVDLLNAQNDAESLSYLLREPVCFPPAREMVRGADGRFHTNDGHASLLPEWDWFWNLPDSERKRLKKWFAEDGLTPDQYASIFDPGGDIESAMGDWVLATSLSDRAEQLARNGSPQTEDKLESVFNALRIIRDQSNLDDDEWAWLCETVSTRAMGPVLGTTLSVSEAYTQAQRDPQSFKGLSAWVSTKELAGVLGISLDLCARWRKRGKLPVPDEMVAGRAAWSRKAVKQFVSDLQELATM